MFFLILLVMFLGALGFAWMQQTKNGELIKARQQARADLQVLKEKELLIQHYIEDLFNVLKKPGSYTGRPQSKALYGDATLEYPGVMNPTEIKAVLDAAANDAKVATAPSLEALLGSMVTRINTQEQRIKELEAERDKAMAAKATGDQRYTQLEGEARSTAAETASNLEQARSDYEAAKSDRDRRIIALQDNVNNLRDQMTQAKEAADAREKELLGKIGLLQTQLSAVTERNALNQPPQVADGKIIAAENNTPVGFINLGRKDLLQRGTVFRVKSANSDAVKGYCQVTRVEEERSQVRFYDFVDPVGDFARPGDLLYNDLYTPRVTRTMYLMGRFITPKEDIANMLRRLGNRVVNKMGPGVDTVVLGNDPVNEAGDGFASVQDSEEFKLANELRVEFTYLSKISDLLKL
ncbi:MAG TPA: hypothetical protein ENI87_09755 [bacterium]|nr:hypothetical protein [bacterium]